MKPGEFQTHVPSPVWHPRTRCLRRRWSTPRRVETPLRRATAPCEITKGPTRPSQCSAPEECGIAASNAEARSPASRRVAAQVTAAVSRREASSAARSHAPAGASPPSDTTAAASADVTSLAGARCHRGRHRRGRAHMSPRTSPPPRNQHPQRGCFVAPLPGPWGLRRTRRARSRPTEPDQARSSPPSRTAAAETRPRRRGRHVPSCGVHGADRPRALGAAPGVRPPVATGNGVRR